MSPRDLTPAAALYIAIVLLAPAASAAGAAESAEAEPLPDYFAANLQVPSPLYPNRTAGFGFEVGNAGSGLPPRGVLSTVAIFLDEVLVARDSGSVIPPGETFFYGWSFLAPEAGTHVFRVVVDVDGNVTEVTRENNVASLVFEVLPTAEIDVEIVRLEAARFATPAGPIEDPVGAFEARVRVCNGAPVAGLPGSLRLSLHPSGASVGPGWSAFEPLPPIAGGSCEEIDARVDASGAIGDFRLRADSFVPNDGARADNVDWASGSRLVAGHGGVRLPVTRPFVADVDPTELAEGNAVWNALNLTEDAVCAAMADVLVDTTCGTLAGDPGLGEIRPCTSRPPASGPGANLPGYLAWWVVSTLEERRTRAPDPIFRSGGTQLPPQAVLDLFPEIDLASLVPTDERVCEPIAGRLDEVGSSF